MGFGDSVSIAERLVHRARAGEIVISLDVMKALRAAVKTLGAEELPRSSSAASARRCRSTAWLETRLEPRTRLRTLR